jgi:hypothetical protein
MRIRIGFLGAVAFASAILAQSPAKPLEPIAAILDAFRTHDIVALSEGKHR